MSVKILVATKETQGQRESDFCFVSEGEVLCLSLECDKDRGVVDGPCGCLRDFVGIKCGKGTTTAKVVIFDGSKTDWEGLIAQSYKEAEIGYLDNTVLWDAADKHPVGMILEKRGDLIQPRILS